MSRICRLTLLSIAVALVADQVPFLAQSPPPASIVIRNVTIISGVAGAVPTTASLVVTGDRIAYVGADDRARIPAGARTIDGKGKFLIPGLIDMHTHLSKARGSSLGLFVASGVTTVRDMGGDHDELLRWRDEVRDGRRVGPRMLIAGPYLEAARNVDRMRGQSVEEMAEPVERTRVPVGSPADAERTIAGLAGRVDHVKIRTVQNRETYLAIAAAARKHGLPLVGHVYSLAPDDIVASGQRSLEHQFLPTLDTLAADARMAFFKQLAAAGTGVVPTLVTVSRAGLTSQAELQAIVDDDSGAREPRRRYVSQFMLIDWREQVLEQTEGRRNQLTSVYASQLRDLREMRQSGMPVMAGTDVAVLNIFPGSSVAEEVELFVRDAGMTPLEALRAATSVPAEFLGLGNDIGTIEPGKVADLVVLDANPLNDIRHLQRVNAVVMRGRLFDRAGLDGVLQAVANADDRRVNDWPRTVRPR